MYLMHSNNSIKTIKTYFNWHQEYQPEFTSSRVIVKYFKFNIKKIKNLFYLNHIIHDRESNPALLLPLDHAVSGFILHLVAPPVTSIDAKVNEKNFSKPFQINGSKKYQKCFESPEMIKKPFTTNRQKIFHRVGRGGGPVVSSPTS